MSRKLFTTGIALASLLVGGAACGGSADEVEPRPGPTTTTTVAPTPQPRGADGVTFDVINWDDYSEDPVVLDYKTIRESRSASINTRTLLPDARRGMSKELLSDLTDSMKFVESKGWTLPTTVKVRVRDVRTQGRQAILTMCVWRPSAIFQDNDGKVVGTPDRYWDREVTKLTRSGDRWVITSEDKPGRCRGGAPA